MSIITRKEAKDNGKLKYYTGKPCKHGHIAERRVSTGACCGCDIITRERHHASHLKASKNWRDANKKKDSKYHKDYYKQHTTHRKEMSQQWKKDNHNHYQNQQRQYYADNKEKLLEYYKEYNKQKYIMEKQELHKLFQQLAVKVPYTSNGYERQFSWHVAGRIISTFEVEVFNEYQIDTQSRIDLYIPEFKLGVEIKLDISYWTPTKVQEQIERYSNALGCNVIAVSPKGTFGMTVNQLITYLQGQQLK